MQPWDVAQHAAKACADRKGQDVVILSIAPISLIADYFVIAGAANKIQMLAIADEVEERLLELGQKMLHREGHGEASWILLDYGAVVIHVFLGEARQFYSLERLWGDAKSYQVES